MKKVLSIGNRDLYDTHFWRFFIFWLNVMIIDILFWVKRKFDIYIFFIFAQNKLLVTITFNHYQSPSKMGRNWGYKCSNVSTTPLRQWGFWQCLLFSWTTLRSKHCRHPIAIMGVVDTFGHYLVNQYLARNTSILRFCYFNFAITKPLCNPSSFAWISGFTIISHNKSPLQNLIEKYFGLSSSQIPRPMITSRLRIRKFKKMKRYADKVCFSGKKNCFVLTSWPFVFQMTVSHEHQSQYTFEVISQIYFFIKRHKKALTYIQPINRSRAAVNKKLGDIFQNFRIF